MCGERGCGRRRVDKDAGACLETRVRNDPGATVELNTRDDLFNTKVRPQTPLAAAGSRDAPLFAARRRRSPLKLPVVVPIRDDADDGILV